MKYTLSAFVGGLILAVMAESAMAENLPFVVKGGTAALGCSASTVVLTPSGQVRVAEASCHSSLAEGGTGELSFESAGQSARSCGLVRMVRNMEGLFAIYTDSACIRVGDDRLDFDNDGVPDKEDVDPITPNLSVVVKDGGRAVKCLPLKVVLTGSGEIQVRDADANCYGAIAEGGAGALWFQSAGQSKACSLVRLAQHGNGQMAIYAEPGCIRTGDDTLDFDGDGIADKDDPDPLTPAASSCASGSPDLNITSAVYAGTVQVTGCSITAGTAVQVGAAVAAASVSYSAETTIRLLPGFSVVAGSSFYAGIGMPALAAREERRTGIPAALGGAADPITVNGARRLGGADLPDALAKRLAGAPISDLSTDDGGRYLVFATEAPLDPRDGNGQRDVYLWDRQEGVLLLVSRTSEGEAGNGPSGQPRIDGGGTHIAYTAGAGNLTLGDDNGADDIHLYRIDTGTTERVSRGEGGTESQGDARNPAISSASPEMLFDRIDADGYRRVYRYDGDWPAAGIQVASLEGALDAEAPGVSPDGRYVAYRETGDGCSVILLDRRQGVWSRVGCPDGIDGARAYIPFFNDDGRSLEWIEADGTSGELLEGEESAPVWMENPLAPAQ